METSANAGTGRGSASADAIVSVEQLVNRLTGSGLLDSKAVGDLIARISPSQRVTSRQLADELVRREVLTAYQATILCQQRAGVLVLGNYILLDRLGAGAMGQVFKALHRRMERVVALKLLPSELTRSPVAVERFQREVKAAARLSHPNIVAAYDADEAGGRHFLIMEYVEGCDLKHLVQTQGPLTVDQVISCIGQVARGLEHAHTAGVIHRDIKPANLLLSPAGTVKILDMGLARRSDVTANKQGSIRTAPQRDLTKLGSVIGTSQFMAPEQALGSKQIDNRVDIYSLGCTLYFLLTGKPPFNGDSVAEVLLAQVEAPVPALAAVRPETPPALDAIFQRMVAKKPDERFASMSKVIAALKTCKSKSSKPLLGILPAARTVSAVADVTSSDPDERGEDSPRPAPLGSGSGGALSGVRRRWIIAGVSGAALLVGLAILIVNLPNSAPSKDAALEKRVAPVSATTTQKPEAVFLCDLPERDVTVGYGSFGKKGDLGYHNKRITVKGTISPHGLSFHPPEQGSARVAYLLQRHYRTFRATAAINDDAYSASPLTFTVWGDGKVLWQSKPLRNRGDVQECSVPVAGVDRLELEVHCPGGSNEAHAVWVEPLLMK